MGMGQRSGSHNPYRIVRFFHIAADFHQLRADGFQMLGNHILHRHIPSGGRCREHKGTSFNLVGDDGIFCSVELLHTADPDHIRSRALDVRSHAVQEIGEIHHMGFLCGVLDDGKTVRKGRRHHDIDGRPHADHVHVQMTPLQGLRFRDDQAMFDTHVCPQRLKSLDVLVDWTASDVTAAGKSHFRLPVLSEKRSQQIVGGTDLLDIIVLDHEVMNLSSVDLYRMPVHPFHKNSDTLHCLKKNVRITHVRHIFNQNRLIRHYRSCKNRKRSVFRAADFHLAHQRIPAANNILFHLHPYPGCDKHPSIKHRHSALLSREQIADAAPNRYPCRPFPCSDGFLKNYYEPLIFLYAKLCLVKSDIEYLKYYTMYTKIMPAINPNAIISHFSGL